MGNSVPPHKETNLLILTFSRDVSAHATIDPQSCPTIVKFWSSFSFTINSSISFDNSSILKECKSKFSNLDKGYPLCSMIVTL